jgi:hypothetical protein
MQLDISLFYINANIFKRTYKVYKPGFFPNKNGLLPVVVAYTCKPSYLGACDPQDNRLLGKTFIRPPSQPIALSSGVHLSLCREAQIGGWKSKPTRT